MLSLPPLDCPRFFEAAARLGSFARAGQGPGVTPRAPSHRLTGRLSRPGSARFTANGRHAASASPQRLSDGFSTR